MDPYYPPPPPDEEQDTGPSLADLLAGVVASDASPDGNNGMDDPRGYGDAYGGSPSPNDAGGTGVDTYGPPAPSSPGAPDWMAGMLGTNADAPGDVTATKPWDAVGPSYQRQDDATPEMPFPGTNTMLATPFGAVAAPAWLPFQTAKPVRPTEEQQQRVEGGQAPVQTWGDVVGGMTRFLQKQGESLPGNVGSQMMPEEQAAERARLGDVFGQEGEALIRPSFGADTMASRVGGAAERAAPALADAAPAAEAAVPASRFFHGTGSDFQTPTADKFDPNGLYGPGYYMTDSSAVAGSYADNAKGNAAVIDAHGLEEEAQSLRDVVEGRDPRWSNDPRQVAYAQQRLPEIEAELAKTVAGVQSGPNVRAVDVPQNLNLLDAEAPASSADLDHVRSALAQMGEQRGVGGQIAQDFDNLMPDTASHLAGARANAESLRAQLADPALSPARRAEIADLLQQTQGAVAALETHFAGQGVTNHQVYEALVNTLDFAYPGQNGRTLANKALASMGYDGVTYAGGLRIPMTDAAGQPIEHTAVAIFPESIGKVRNAISGLPGGVADQGVVNPRTSDLAARGLGALGGAAASQTGTDENTTWQERVARGLIGAEAGTRMGAALAGHGGASGLLRAADDGLVDAHGRPIGRPPENNLGGLLDANGDPLRAGATDADWEALGADTGSTDPARARLEGARARLAADPGATAPPGGTPPGAGGTPPPGGTPPNPNERAAGTPPAPAGPFAWMPEGLRGPAATTDALVRDVGLGRLANPASVGAIAIKNALELPTRAVMGIANSVIRRQPQEIPGQVAAFTDALTPAVRAFWSGMTEPLADLGPRAGYEGIENRHDIPVVGGLANALRQSVRPHVGITNATGLVARAQEIARQAELDATHQGLAGPARAQRVADLSGKAHAAATAILDGQPLADADPVAQRIAQAAVAAGQRANYTEDLGPVAQRFQDVVRSIPVLGQVAAPYTKIPSNVAARAFETTPIGVVGTLWDVARGAYGDLSNAGNRAAQLTGTAGPRAAGVSPLNERLVRNALGAGLMVTGYAAAEAGVVVGDRPDPADDPHATALFDERGIPPNSLYIPGANRYVPLTLLGTNGLSLKIGASLHDAHQAGRTVPAEAFHAMGQIADETPLRGTLEIGRAVAEAVHALNHPAGGEDGLTSAVSSPEADRLIRGQTEGWVPGAGPLRALGNALDPVERQVNGVGDAAKYMVPGLRNTLPPRLNQLGHAQPNPRSGLNALNPLAQRQETDDPTLRMLASHGVTVSSGKVPEQTADEAPWTPGQLDLYHRTLGPVVERYTTAVSSLPEFARWTPAQQTSGLQAAVARAKTDVYKNVNTSAALASIRPDALQALATKYDRAPNTRARDAVVFQSFPLRDYLAWTKVHGGRPSDPATIQRYVGARPQ